MAEFERQRPLPLEIQSKEGSDLLAITGAAVDALGSSCMSDNYVYPEHKPKITSHSDVAFARSFSRAVQSSLSESDPDLNQTAKSQSSIASSSLLNGTATKVKISSKKLKQIKSPFELPDSSSNVPSEYQEQINYETSGAIVEKHHPNTKQIVSKHTLMHQPLNADSLTFSKGVTTVTDSGYATHNIQVIHEIQGELVSQNTSHEDIESLDEQSQEIIQERVVEAIHHSGSSQNSICTQPEIITVENSLNQNVSKGEQMSQDEMAVTESRPCHPDEQLQQRFSRFQPALLKQGSLESDGSSLNSTGQKDQVHIEQYNLTDKKRLLKQSFLKRQNQGPVKRQVQPKLVGPQVTESKYKKAAFSNKGQEIKNTTNDMNEAVKTAAVAAASAVAATEPFLRAQQDVESKMAQILERLAATETKSKTHVGTADTSDDITKQKVESLEKQLHNLTQKRLDYLEKIQKQQVMWQARMISMSQGPSPLEQKQALHKSVYIDPSILKSQQQTPNRPVYDDIQKEKAVLATPAPRVKPPQPTSMFDEMKTPSPKRSRGGFLAHILNSQEETPKHSPFPATPTSPYYKRTRDRSPTVKKAENLLQELSGLNNEIQYAVNNVDVQKVYTGPAPLDHYMSKAVDIPPSSPYPSRTNVSSGDVPVQDNYADAQATLKEAKKTSALLEANIDAILKARHESEVYATLDSLTYGSASERLRIRKMVDEHITNMSSDMEREIMEELLRIEEKKRMTFMIPERDTSTVKGKTQLKTAGRSKGKVQSRIDSGMRKAESSSLQQKSTSVGKENLPAGKLKYRPLKKVKPVRDEVEMKQVYGKTAHHGQRGTQKDPYIRLKTQPKSKALPPPMKQTVKGIPMATAKTQTSAPSVVHYDGMSKSQTVPQMPMAIPLGIPRRIGTIQIPPGSKVQQAAPSPIGMPRPTTTSTPITHPVSGGNVGLVEMKESFEDDDTVPYKPQLTKQVLPSVNIKNDQKRTTVLIKKDMPNVDIDTDRSISPSHMEALQTNRSGSPSLKQSARSVKTTPRSKSPLQKFVKDAAQELQEAMDEAQFLQESFEEASQEDDVGISLPGYTRPRTYDQQGPQFPPPSAPRQEFDPSSDVIAADIRRKDLLANKAVHWVEQELMARIISEAYSGRGPPLQKETKPETVPHTTPVPKRSRVHEYKDDVDTISTLSDQPSQHDSLIAEALGQEGMKLFVDAGQPVDENLVHALIKEVLLEKYQNTLGQKTSVDDEGMNYRVKSPRKSKAAVPTTPSTSNVVITSVKHVRRSPSPPVQIPDTPVATPEPTPKGSPRVSPPPRKVPTPPETPDVTPEPSVAEDIAQPVTTITKRQEVYYEDEDDMIQGYTEKKFAQQQQQEDDLLPSRHDVKTPENTPPPSAADITARTPSPSVEDYTPIPSEVEDENVTTPQVSPPPTPPIIEEDIKETLHETLPKQLIPEPVERGQQTSPGPPPSEQTEGDETETSSWNTAASDTAGEPLSEGQWILSHQSEGEVLPRINADIHHRMRERMFSNNLRISQEDTLNEATEFEQDTPNATQSEGEVLHGPRGVENDPYLMMLSTMPDPQYMFRGGKLPRTGTDKSLGEVVLEPPYHGNNVARSSRRKLSNGQTLVSPGEFLSGGEGPLLQPKKWNDMPQDQDHEDDDGNYVHIREVQSPVPTVKTITVRPSTPEECPPQDINVSRANQRPTTHTSVTSQPPIKSQVKSQKPSMGRGLGSGLRPQISMGGRPPSPDKRVHRREETRRSQEVLYGTTSDLESRTMTPDQMNVDVLLASQDYLGETQSELLSTDDLGTTGVPWRKSSEYVHQSGDYMRRSNEMRRRSSQEVGRRSQEISETGEFALRSEEMDINESGEYIPVRTGRMIDTFGSTSDMSLPEGMTQTLEREELSHTVDSESDLKLSAKYPDSLEGTGGKGTEESVTREQYVKHITTTTTTTITKREDHRRKPSHLSVTIPSMADEEEPSEDYDVSELSLT